MKPQDVRRAASMVERLTELNERIKYLDHLVRILANGRHKSVLKMDIKCLDTKERREYEEAKKIAGESEIDKYNREIMEMHKQHSPFFQAYGKTEKEEKHHPEDHHLELKLQDVMGIQVLAVVLDCYTIEKQGILDALKELGVNYESNN